MLAIEVELLVGRYVATEYNDRSAAEWPPHPARFFSALVAALHDREPVDAAERASLVWLEQQAPPELDVDVAVGRRVVHQVFVPVNDVTLAGDTSAAVIAAREELGAFEHGGAATSRSSHITKARRLVEREAKFAAFPEPQPAPSLAPAASAVKIARALLPPGRPRQARTFPAILPERPVFAYIWPAASPASHAEALGRLCDRVTRLGHSSSLVRCTVLQQTRTPSLVPLATGDHVLRVVGPGQLDRLTEAYARHQGIHQRTLAARPQRYGPPRPPTPDEPRSVFSDDWIVFERVGGDRPLSSRGADLALAVRRALIEVHGTGELPPVLSGHAGANEPATVPHLAFVPLPWVGHEQADGTVQGLALIMPRSIESRQRELLLRLLAKWETTRGIAGEGYAVEIGTTPGSGRRLKVSMRREDVPTKSALNAARWCRPAQRFVTATPIALDRHPGDLRSNAGRAAQKAAAEAERSIADACTRIGLPRPARVSIALTPLLPGAQHVKDFAPWPRKPGAVLRARVHADILFAEPVRGPVLLGAGRYFGLGLCLPAPSRASEAHRASEGDLAV